jgi:pSer/pThr/pTyr-binding forkhead associated (FHA) protein
MKELTYDGINSHLMEHLQMLARPGCVGRLTVTQNYVRGYLYLYEGMLVHAEVEDLEGLPACQRILAWDHCELAWEDGLAPATATLGSSPDMLLFEVLSEANTMEGAASASAAHESLLLRVLNGQRDGEVFEVSKPTVVLGGDDNCDIVLPDPTISRMHCQIRQVGGQILAEDLNSTNGTLLNGHSFHSGEIQSGDCLQLGQTLLQLEVALKRPAAAARQTMKIGRPVTSVAFPMRTTGPIRWRSGDAPAEAAANGRPGTSSALKKQLLRFTQSLKVHLPNG